MRICSACNSRMGLYANKCSFCGSTRWFLSETRSEKTKEEISKEQAREHAIEVARQESLDRQIDVLEKNARKTGTYIDWASQPPEIQYRNYCKKIEERNRKNHEPRPVRVFSFQTGYVSGIKELIHYTQQGHIKWNYCQTGSYYDLDKDEFCLVFVSSTYCILEVRGSGKKAKRVYSGYIKLGEDKDFQIFDEWRSIYTKIKNSNKEWDTKNLLNSLKGKKSTNREKNWTKIILVSAKDAKDTERYFNYVPKDEIPMSYASFLSSVVYSESWGSCGISGGTFSPR